MTEWNRDAFNRRIADRAIAAVMSWEHFGVAGPGPDGPIDLPDEPELLAQLARHSRAVMREAVADHPNTPVEALARLALDNEPLVRAALLLNSSARLPELVQRRLLNDGEPIVRAAYASSPYATAEQLGRLADDPSVEVRVAICTNEKTPEAALTFIGATRNPELKYRLARNRQTLPRVLVAVAEYADATTAEELTINNATPAEGLRIVVRAHEHPLVLGPMSTHPNAPPDVLLRMAQIASKTDRLLGYEDGLAQNPATPPEALALLCVKTSDMVLQAITMHPAATADVLDRLADRVHFVREIVEHPNTSRETLERIRNRESFVPQDVRRAIDKRLSS